MGSPPAERQKKQSPDCLHPARTTSREPRHGLVSDALPASRVDLTRVPPGERLHDVFVVLDVEQRGGDTPHTILTFGNASGRLPSAPVWASERYRIADIIRGQGVRLAGVISTWRDRRQIAIESLEILSPAATPWTELLPSVENPARYWSDIDKLRGEIQAPRLAEVLAIFFDDTKFRNRFQSCPGSLSGHHGKIGGLLQHTCEVAHFSRTLAGHFTRTDAELLLAGALLHDIGKLEAYCWEGIFEMTVPGRVIGHVVLGTLMLDRRIHRADAPPCTATELVQLHHLILSHHGVHEHGAPVLPMTLEAELLHQADLASARGASMEDALADPSLFMSEEEISARGVWQLDRRRVWRGRSDWGRVATDDG